MAAKILLALKDKGDIEGIRKFLEEKGFQFTIATDGAKAIEMALKDAHSVIIADVGLPVISGERLFHILKNNPKTAKLPFIFISDNRVEIKGFRTGVDVFIVKPFQFDELTRSIKEMQIIGGDGKTVGEKDIQGKLSQMPIVDILQVLHFNKREGELTITSDSSIGVVYIKDGHIYNAMMGEVEKEKALYRMLRWKEGTFEFHPTTVTLPQRIHTTTGNLLMEGMRQLDEFEKAKALFPGENSLLKTRVDTGTLPKGLKPIIYEILFLVEYYPRVNDLVDHCSFPDYDVYKTLTSLLTRRIIEEIKEDREKRTVSEEFISPNMAIRLKEKVVTRWPDMLSVNFGRVFVTATSETLPKNFILACKNLPDFFVDKKLASKETNETLIGEIGNLKLYGDLEVVFFSTPAAKNMAPFLKTFMVNLIGLIILWDESGEKLLPDIAAMRGELTSKRRIPAIYVYAGKPYLTKELILKYKGLLGLRADEPIYHLTESKESILKIFLSFFDCLIKEDYVAVRNYAL